MERKNPREGYYILLKQLGNTVIAAFNSCSEPSQIFALHFTNLDSAEALKDIQFDIILLDQVKIHDQELLGQLSSITKETVTLENGAEGYLFKLADEHLADSPSRGENGKHPLITIIHGGPFSSSPSDIFLLQRNFLLL